MTERLAYSWEKEHRLNIIFRLIRQGYTADEIHKMLPPVIDRKCGRGDNSKEIGNRAEERAVAILSAHPWVLNVIPHDQKAVDGLIVPIEGLVTVEAIPYQVKNSEKLALKYFESDDYYGVADQFGVPPIIVVSGPSYMDEEIAVSVDLQFQAIASQLSGN